MKKAYKLNGQRQKIKPIYFYFICGATVSFSGYLIAFFIKTFTNELKVVAFFAAHHVLHLHDRHVACSPVWNYSLIV